MRLLATQGDARWDLLKREILDQSNGDKVVLFAQPIETVTSLADYLERVDGRRPAMIIGGQKPEERTAEVEAFWRADGPRFLISSRAGGEGYNLQVAHVLVHVDVPWNPMELEQRVGRIHRFMSRRTIQVHTMVVKDSREVDMYEVARMKLRSVAETLGPDRFEELFARVMALVPPEDLAGVLVRDALGPLDASDQAELARIVTEGYRRWERFDNEFSTAQRRILEVPAGEARWEDVERFAVEHLGAQRVDGYFALKFRFEGREVVEASEGARVVSVAGELFACGDYGSTPVTAPNGGRVRQLGLNVEEVSVVLRRLGLPEGGPGVAYLKGLQLPTQLAALEESTALLVYGRVSLSVESNAYKEVGLELRVFAVGPSGTPRELDSAARAGVVRAALDAPLRRDPNAPQDLRDAIRRLDAELNSQLRRPAQPSVRHVLFPVAVLVLG